MLPTVDHLLADPLVAEPLVQPNSALVPHCNLKVDPIEVAVGGGSLDGSYQSRAYTPALEGRSNIEREQSQRSRYLEAMTSHAHGSHGPPIQLGHQDFPIPVPELFEPMPNMRRADLR